MAKKYTLHYLSDKEFDNLPYKYSKTAWGAADEKTGNAYVRRTGIRPIDEFVTEHEIAELVAKVSPHEVDGIRYKGGNFLDNISNAVVKTVIDPINSGIKKTGLDKVIPSGTSFGATVPFGPGGTSSNKGTTGTNTSTSNKPYGPPTQAQNQLGFTNLNQTTPAVAGQGGYGENTPKGVMNMGTWSAFPGKVSDLNKSSDLGFRTPAINISSTNPLKGIPSASGQGLATSAQDAYSSISPTAKTPGETNTNLMEGAIASNLGFQAPQTANVPLQTIKQAPASPTLQGGGEISQQDNKKDTESETPWLDDLFGKDWRKTLLGEGLKTAAGAGVSALGQAMAKKPQVANPADSALYNEVVDRVKSGAQVELSPAQRDAITFNYDQQLEQAKKNIMQRFKALRPGSDISNDSQLQSALVELENDFAEQKAAAITAAQLGLTQQQTAQLSQLAASDINYLSQVAGVSNQEAADFKAMMASLGAMVANTGKPQVIYHD